MESRKKWKLSTITKREANILLLNLYGPLWAISSHEKDWTQHPSQMWRWANLKPRILQTADKVLQLAHMLQTGKEMPRVNIPKEPAQHLRHAKQKIIFWTQNRKNEPTTYNARSTQEQASFTLREQDKHEPRPDLENWRATKAAISSSLMRGLTFPQAQCFSVWTHISVQTLVVLAFISYPQRDYHRFIHKKVEV